MDTDNYEADGLESELCLKRTTLRPHFLEQTTLRQFSGHKVDS